MKRLTIATLLIVCALTTGCDVIKSFWANPLPDLTIGYASYQTEPWGACTSINTVVYLEVNIVNQGSGAAGPFQVSINGQEQSVSQGLGAGQSISLKYQSGRNAEMGSIVTIVIDPKNAIQETDKTNNSKLDMLVPVLTMAPDCTPTATP